MVVDQDDQAALTGLRNLAGLLTDLVEVRRHILPPPPEVGANQVPVPPGATPSSGAAPVEPKIEEKDTPEKAGEGQAPAVPGEGVNQPEAEESYTSGSYEEESDEKEKKAAGSDPKREEVPVGPPGLKATGKAGAVKPRREPEPAPRRERSRGEKRGKEDRERKERDREPRRRRAEDEQPVERRSGAHPEPPAHPPPGYEKGSGRSRSRKKKQKKDKAWRSKGKKKRERGREYFREFQPPRY